MTMFLVDVDNVAGDGLAERSGVELEAIDLLDDLVRHEVVGLGGDHAVDGGRSLDLGGFDSKFLTNHFILFRKKRNRIFRYFIQSVTFKIMQILLEISYGNLVYLGINLLGSVDAFDLKNNILTLKFQFFGLLVSDVVIR